MLQYTDIDDFFAHQTPEIRQLLQYVRQLILVSHPKIRERFMYNSVPFYLCLDYVCYFGKIHKTKGVEICFVKGFLLPDPAGVLEAHNRKYIRGMTFRNLKDFQDREEAFLEVLQEAILFNETQPEKTFAKIMFQQRKK
jgi:hypothetical protein